MSHDTRWFVPRAVRTLAAVACAVGATVGIFAQPASAQQGRPDLAITSSLFDGKSLRVEYVNATGVYDRRRYEVGFQWHDAAGEPVGMRHWLPVPVVERGGVSILDAASHIELSYRSGRSVLGRRLAQFVEERPGVATELRITLDDGDRIAEASETNNVVRLSVPLPDIVLRSATVAGDTLTVAYANPTGTRVPGSFRIAFQWMTGDGIPVGYEYGTQVAYLEPREERTFPRSARETLYAGSGNRQSYTTVLDLVRNRPANAELLRVVLDAEQGIAEADEQNNSVTAVPERPKPDLAVVDAAWMPGQFTLTYRNRGVAAASAPSIWFHFADAQGRQIGPLAWLNTGTLAAGAAATVRSAGTVLGSVNGTVALADFLVKPPEGATHLKALVDGPNAIVELAEHNNTVLLENPVVPLPDLTVTNVALGDGAITWTLQNIGDTVSGQFHFEERIEWLAADGAVLNGWTTDTSTPKILAGFVSNRDIRVAYEIPMAMFIAPSGATKLRVTVDPKNTVEEKDEQHNSAELAFPKRLPDLTLSDLTLGKDAITWKLTNVGDAVSGNFHYEERIEWVDADGKIVQQRVTDTSTSILTTRDTLRDLRVAYGIPAAFFTPPAGAVKLRVWVDPKNEVEEKREDNDTVSISVARPDLTVTNLTIGKGTISWTENNVGDTVRGNFTYHTVIAWLDASGAVLSERATQSATAELRAGSSSPEELSARFGTPREFLAPPAGAVQLRVGVDPLNTVVERHEDNNIVSIAVAFPDLVVTNLTMGKDVITWKEENVGSAHEGGYSFVTSIEWLDTHGKTLARQDPQIASSDTLPHGVVNFGELSGRFGIAREFLAPPAGAVQLRVTIDVKNTVAEKDEENNSATVAVEVPPPDLTISNAKLADDTLTFTYHNAGGSAAASLSLWFHFANTVGTQIGPLYWVDVDALPAGGTRSFTAKNVMVGSDAGPHPLTEVLRAGLAEATHLKIMVDGPHRILESNELNNAALVVKPVQPLPDLVVRDAQLTADGLAVTFVNIGDRAALSVPWAMVWVAADGQPIGEAFRSAWPTLAPKGTIAQIVGVQPAVPGSAVAYLVQPPDRAERLRISVNPGGTIAESDAGNNAVEVVRLRRTPSMAPTPPDLAAGAVSVRDGALIIPVTNRGTTASVPTDLWLQWYGKGKWIPGSGAVDVPAIVGGATVEIAIPLDRTFGPDGKLLTDIPTSAERLRVFLDGLRTVEEGDEDNNTSYVRRSVLPVAVLPADQPDLAFAKIVNRADGGATLQMVNRGKGGAPAFTWSTQWEDANGTLLGEPILREGTPMVPGYSYIVTIDPRDTGRLAMYDAIFGKQPPGAVRVRFTIDPANTIAETDEANNSVAWVPLATQTKENALPVARAGADVTMLDANGDGDEMLTLSGEASSDPDGTIIDWRWTEGEKTLARSTRFDYRAEIGAHTLTLTVTDDRGASASDTVTITTNPRPVPERSTRPDLVVTNITMTPSVPSVGQHVSFTATFQNIGATGADASTAWLTMDFDNDDVPDAFPSTEELGVIAAKAFGSATWTDAWEATAGTHAFGVCADVNEDVAEADEQNNCRTITPTVARASGATVSRRIVHAATAPIVDVVGALLGATPIRASRADEQQQLRAVARGETGEAMSSLRDRRALQQGAVAFFHQSETAAPSKTSLQPQEDPVKMPSTPPLKMPSTPPPPPLPNLTIVNTWFQIEGNLIIRYANNGAAALPPTGSLAGTSNLSFWAAWADASGAVVSSPGWFWMDTVVRAPASGDEESLAIRPDGPERFVAHGLGVSTGLTPAAFLRTQPRGATQLIVLVDGPNAYGESNENDNRAAATLLAPNLRLRDASLADDRASLSFTFENQGATTIWPPAGRDRVSIQYAFTWNDAAGQPVSGAPSYTIGWAYTSVAAGAAQHPVLRDDSAWRFVPVVGGSALTFTDLLRTAPAGARNLAITLDSAQAVAEIREYDNAVTVDIPLLPNLHPTFEDQGNGDYVIGFTNAGDAAIPLPPSADRTTVSLWFAWGDASGNPLATTTWYWDDVTLYAADRPRQPGESFSRLYRDDAEHIGIRRHGDPVTAASRITIGDVFREAPTGAATLLVTVDGSGVMVEQDERDNRIAAAVTIPRPNLRATAQDIGSGGYTFGFTNAGDAVIPLPPSADRTTVSLWFAWGDASGNPLATTTWYWDDVTLYAADRPRQPGESFSRLYRDDDVHLGIRRHGDPVTAASRITIGDVFREAPTGAATLLVTVDGPDTTRESSETDNGTVLAVVVPRPDLRPIAWQEYQREDDGGFSMSFENVGAVGVPTRRGASTDVPVSVWFAWGDATGKPSLSTPWYWRDDFVVQASGLVSGRTSLGFRVRADQSRIHRWGDAADGSSLSLADIRSERPGGATHLLAFIDGADRIIESDETNNVLAIPIPLAGTAAAPTPAVVQELPQEEAAPSPASAVTPTPVPTPAPIAPSAPAPERRLSSPAPRPVAAPASEAPPTPPVPAAVPLHVIPSATPTEGEPPLRVAFRADVTGGTPPYTYLWLFTDGVTSSTASFDRTFPRVGARDAVVNVRDASGASASASVNVRVRVAEAAPDLIVEALAVEPPDGPSHVVRSVIATIRNIGPGAAAATAAWFLLDLDADDTPDALPTSAAVPSLAAGGSTIVSWRDAFIALTGTHAVEVCADVYENDAEVNERNNCARSAFTAGRRLTSPSPQPAPPPSQPSAPAPAPPAAPPPASEPAPIPAPQPAPPPVAPSEPAPAAPPPPPPEARTEPAVPTAPALLPNLRVDRRTVSPPAPVVGDTPTFTAELRNAGDGDAGETTATLTIDSDRDGVADAGPFTVDVVPLASGAWTRPAWERVMTAVAGTFVAEFCVDAAQRVTESDETDNCGTLEVTVTEPPPPDSAPRRRLLF